MKKQLRCTLVFGCRCHLCWDDDMMYDDCDMCIYDQAEMNMCFGAVMILGMCGEDDTVCMMTECYEMVNQLTGCAYEHCIDSTYRFTCSLSYPIASHQLGLSFQLSCGFFFCYPCTARYCDFLAISFYSPEKKTFEREGKSFCFFCKEKYCLGWENLRNFLLCTVHFHERRTTQKFTHGGLKKIGVRT